MIQELNKFEAVFRDSLKTAFINVDHEYIDTLLDKRDLPEFSGGWMDGSLSGCGRKSNKLGNRGKNQ